MVFMLVLHAALAVCGLVLAIITDTPAVRFFAVGIVVLSIAMIVYCARRMRRRQ